MFKFHQAFSSCHAAQRTVMVGDFSTPWWVYAVIAGVTLVAIGVCVWLRQKDHTKPKHWKK